MNFRYLLVSFAVLLVNLHCLLVSFAVLLVDSFFYHYRIKKAAIPLRIAAPPIYAPAQTSFAYLPFSANSCSHTVASSFDV